MLHSGTHLVGLAAAGIVAAAGLGIASAPAGTPATPARSTSTRTADLVGPVAPHTIDCPKELRDLIGSDSFDAMDEVHKKMLANLTKGMRPDVIAPCFMPGSDDQVVAAFEAVFNRLNPERYNQTSRWSGTVASGSAGAFGEAITLTYSFVPDGTPVPDGVGEGAGNSNLFSYLNGIYGGNPATWQALYDQIFARWQQLSGINYVYEPNDDGVQLFTNAGVAGVRGDLRMSGKFIDGPSNILAYNFFPNNGDMVIDTGDTFFNTTASNSLRLRNVLAHEHGHGMGQLHVCPIQQTKLMEPTVSTAYDGPRHDDIRNVQRFYGDPNEPDNDPGSASDFGVLAIPSSVSYGAVPAPTVVNGSLASIDANGEQDYYRFTVNNPAQVSVTVSPIGTTYLDDVQNCAGASASCCSSASTNSLSQADLAVDVIDTNGASVLGTASSQPIGVAETAGNVFLPAAGEYYIRVYETGSVTETQLYTIDVTVDEPPFIPVSISFPGGVPTELTPGAPNAFTVNIDPGDETLTPGSEVLSYRYDGGSFVNVPLAFVSGTQYTATLPPPSCDDSPEFHVSVNGSLSGLVRSPQLVEFTAIVGTAVPVANVDFQDGTGWSVASDASLTAGAWERGVPVNGNRGDPPSDYDGSGQCYLTQNNLGPLNDGNSDVDGGETRLTSPVYSIVGVVDPVLTYARWFSNDLGDNPQATTMTIEVSDNGGGSWTTLEVVGPNTGSPNPEVSGGWVEKSFDLSAVVGETSQFRVRFRVSDPIGAIVEAGVDAFAISGRTCVDVPVCPGDITGDGMTNSSDFNVLAGNFGAGPGATFAQGDLNNDGFVNSADFNILAGAFGCGTNP